SVKPPLQSLIRSKPTRSRATARPARPATTEGSKLPAPRLGLGGFKEVGCSETPALTPDPSPNGWARGAPRKGSDIRRDETSSGHADSTLSGVFGLKRQPRAANPNGGPGTNRHQPPISQSAADF